MTDRPPLTLDDFADAAELLHSEAWKAIHTQAAHHLLAVAPLTEADLRAAAHAVEHAPRRAGDAPAHHALADRLTAAADAINQAGKNA